MNDLPHIISLGGGVQSSTMALMAAAGLISPMPVAAVFADTQAEPESVYKWLEWLTPRLPFPVHVVSAGSLTERITKNRVNKTTGVPYYSNMIPAFTKNPDGSKGLIGRSCTTTFKIEPIHKKVRQLANIKRGQKTPGLVQWIGISLDEATRMKPSREAWSTHRWPLIELGMKRHDCLRWMEANGFPKPPRSACVYCPFHSDAEWQRLKTEEPEAFTEACRVEVGLQIAHAEITTPGKMRGKAFLHSSLKPLGTVDFSSDTERLQINLFENDCTGMCGN